MQAVIKTGGKQYRVSAGDRIRVESLQAEAGDEVEFNQILMLGNGENSRVGNPVVEGSKVSGKVIAHGRSRKVRIVKFKRRKQHLKRQGHRQNYTEIEITGISESTD